MWVGEFKSENEREIFLLEDKRNEYDSFDLLEERSESKAQRRKKVDQQIRVEKESTESLEDRKKIQFLCLQQQGLNPFVIL